MLNYIRTHAEDFDAVCITKVVFEIELGEVERDDKLCEVGREMGRAEEADSEIGTMYGGEGGSWLAQLVGWYWWEGAVVSYRYTFFVPKGMVGEEE